jgi:NADH dehydrogenase/NADH:ubiquinone oxidoreductase subunit G
VFNILLSTISKDFYNLDERLNIIFGKSVDLETILVLKYFFNDLNCFSLFAESSFCTNSSDILYKFNSRIKDINKNDICILVNCNTRTETSMLNLHLRKSVKSGKMKVGYFGTSMDLTFNAKHLGFNTKSFFDLLKGKHHFSKSLKSAKNPRFIINPNSFSNNELIYINSLLEEHLNLSSKNLDVLNIEGSSTNLRSVGIKSINDIKQVKTSYNLLINTNLNKKQSGVVLNPNVFSIYLGSHGVDEVNKSDLVLPGKAFSEKKSSYINLEGLLQTTRKSLVGLTDSREDWTIFNAFFEFIDRERELNLRTYELKILLRNNPDNLLLSLHYFFSLEYSFLITKGSYSNTLNLNISKMITNNFSSNQNYFYKSRVLNFFKTDTISSLSRVMTECSNNIRHYNFNK